MPLSSVAYLLPLLLLSSSSSPLYIYFLKFYLCLYLIWEKHFEGRVFDQQNTKQHWSATKNHQVPTEILKYLLKTFKSLHALFVLVNDLFVLFWVLKKFMGKCFAFFFSFVDICSVFTGSVYFHVQVTFLIYDKKSSNPLFSVQITLDWDLIF